MNGAEGPNRGSLRKRLQDALLLFDARADRLVQAGHFDGQYLDALPQTPGEWLGLAVAAGGEASLTSPNGTSDRDLLSPASRTTTERTLTFYGGALICAFDAYAEAAGKPNRGERLLEVAAEEDRRLSWEEALEERDALAASISALGNVVGRYARALEDLRRAPTSGLPELTRALALAAQAHAVNAPDLTETS